MIGIIIQARSGSTRLPNKMLLPFYENKGLLEIIILKLKSEINNIPIILATTDTEKDQGLSDLGEMLQVKVFRGNEMNVLKRFISAAQQNNITKIIRICADNPFLDMKSLKYLIEEFQRSDEDYISFQTKTGIPSIKTHFGFWAEAVTLEALIKIENSTNEQIFLEHVTNFIYTNKTLFRQKFFTIPTYIEENNIRLTVDTKKDFELSKIIYEEIKKNNLTEILQIVDFISKREDWMLQMGSEIKKNSK